MILSKGLTRLSLAVGLFALVLGLSGTFASEAHAQNPPATVYGTVAAGDVVEAFVGGVSCGSATADATGFWMMQIEETAPCSPSDSDPVTFTLNGAATEDTGSIWQAGGAPVDAANGITLTLAAAAPGAPAPPATGNAGLLAESGSNLWLALGLGALALALLAGGRAVATRSR